MAMRSRTKLEWIVTLGMTAVFIAMMSGLGFLFKWAIAGTSGDFKSGMLVGFFLALSIAYLNQRLDNQRRQ